MMIVEIGVLAAAGAWALLWAAALRLASMWVTVLVHYNRLSKATQSAGPKIVSLS